MLYRLIITLRRWIPSGLTAILVRKGNPFRTKSGRALAGQGWLTAVFPLGLVAGRLLTLSTYHLERKASRLFGKGPFTNRGDIS